MRRGKDPAGEEFPCHCKARAKKAWNAKKRENSMDCVRTQQLIRPYLEGILSDRELEEFLDHVEHCQTCFGELEVYFSIYRTLNNVDEKGNYNYAEKLHAKLKDSREYLRVRQRNRVIKVGVILAAELSLIGAFYALIRMPGGYIDRHHTEIIPVIETEAAGTLGEAAQTITSQQQQAQTSQPQQAQ